MSDDNGKVGEPRVTDWAARYKTDGVCEIGAVNPNVADYMRHWEARATKAEALAAERDAAIARAEAAEKERDALQAFKAYTHQRLDGAGVPTHPDGPHSAKGCRVGDRFDILLAQLEQARAEQDGLRAALREMTSLAELVDHGDDWIGRGVAGEQIARANTALAATAAKEPQS